MKILLWLDDIRNPFDYVDERTWIEAYSPIGIENVKCIWIKTYNEFCDYINQHGLPDAICFDNDLGEEKEGYDCAKFVVNYCLNNDSPAPLYNIQSANPVAVENIDCYLKNFIEFNK